MFYRLVTGEVHPPKKLGNASRSSDPNDGILVGGSGRFVLGGNLCLIDALFFPSRMMSSAVGNGKTADNRHTWRSLELHIQVCS